MSDGRVRRPEELGALLDELDRMMDESARLRQEVMRQIDEHRDSHAVVEDPPPRGARRPDED